MNRNEEAAKSRRRFTERLACTLVLTIVQLAAGVVIVTRLNVDGLVGLAVAMVLSGALIAVCDAWRELKSSRRALSDDKVGEDLVAA